MPLLLQQEKALTVQSVGQKTGKVSHEQKGEGKTWNPIGLYTT